MERGQRYSETKADVVAEEWGWNVVPYPGPYRDRMVVGNGSAHATENRFGEEREKANEPSPHPPHLASYDPKDEGDSHDVEPGYFGRGGHHVEKQGEDQLEIV